MKNFDLKLGFTCNNNCVHCVISDKRKYLNKSKGTEDLTFNEIKEVVLALKDKKAITLTGGEPTIRKDFVEIVEFIYSQGHVVHLQTNGTGLSDPNVVEKVKDKIEHILIAIHSSDEEVHNKVVGDSSGKMYKKTISGFNNILAAGISCSTQTVLSSYNIKSLYETYKWIQGREPGIVMHMTYAHSMGNAKKNEDLVALKYKNIKKELHKCLKHYARFISTEAIPLCYLFPYENDVNLNYDILSIRSGRGSGLDPSMKYGNYKSELIDEDGIMKDYGIANRRDKRKAIGCRECTFFDECPGVWKEYLYKYKNSLDLYPIKFNGANPSLILTYEECINECNFCRGMSKTKWKMLDRNNKENFIQDKKDKIDFFISKKHPSLELSGEPSQNTRTAELVKYAYDGGIKEIIMSTHGRGLIDEEFVIALSEAGLTSARIPLYGGSKEIHEKTAWSKNSSRSSFEEAVAGIKNCIKHGIKIIGSTTVNNNNKHDLINIFNLYRSLATDDSTKFKEFMIVNTGISVTEYEWTAGWYTPIKDLGRIYKQFVESISSIAQNESIMVKFIDIPYCSFGEYSNLIENRITTPDLGIDKVSDEMASKENSGIPHYRIKEYFKECENCIHKSYCAGWIKNDLMMFGNYGIEVQKNV